MKSNRIEVGNQDLIWDYFQNEGNKAFTGSRPRIKYIVEKIKPGLKLLNIGVGGAILEDLALSKGIDVHSIDPNKKVIEKLHGQHNMGNKAKIGYSNKIEFDDEMFDVVVMSEVLEHLDDDVLEKTITEVMRVLISTGEFIITVPFEEILSINDVVCPHCNAKFHRWGHQQSFDIDKLKLLLMNNGFEIEEANVRCFPDWSRKGVKNLIKSCFRYVLGRFGAGISQPNIFMRAKKH